MRPELLKPDFSGALAGARSSCSSLSKCSDTSWKGPQP